MRFAYADPPYLGYSTKFYGDLHPESAIYDSIEGHAALVARLMSEFSDGWVMSCTSGNLHDILPLCPKTARIGAWVKPFCSFKLNVSPAYAWEPVIFFGGRKKTLEQETVRDWVAANITMQRGFIGAKPKEFVTWILGLLNVQPEDEFVDLFPGSGAVGDYVKAWREGRTGIYQDSFWKTE